MTDIPAEPYDVGDHVRIQLAVDGAESDFEDTVCRVRHVFADRPAPGPDADDDGREMDHASYRLEDAESAETLPVVFRHRDLVPAGERA